VRWQELERVNRYLDGELEPTEKTAFEDRLGEETFLSIYTDEMRALEETAAALEVFKAPEIDPAHRVRWPFRNVRHRTGPFLAGAAVAAVCILVAMGMGVRFFESPAAVIPTEAFRMVYYAPDADSVSVLGDFNGWSREIPFKPKGEEGYWLAEVQVKPGEYRYILIVDGKERPGDPLADYFIDDDFGSKNSVVRIGL